MTRMRTVYHVKDGRCVCVKMAGLEMGKHALVSNLHPLLSLIIMIMKKKYDRYNHKITQCVASENDFTTCVSVFIRSSI